MNQNETESTNKVAGRKRRYLTYALEAGLFIAVFFAVSAWQSRNLLGTDRVPAPSLSAVTLDGDRYDLATSSGKPVLVYFFAPWCAFCSASADNVVRLRKLRDEAGLDIIAVALDWQSRDEVREYASDHELNVPVLLADPTKFKKATGWELEYSFEQTLGDLLDYWRDRLRRDLP